MTEDAFYRDVVPQGKNCIWTSHRDLHRPLCICRDFRSVVFVLIIYCTPSHMGGSRDLLCKWLAVHTSKINKKSE